MAHSGETTAIAQIPTAAVINKTVIAPQASCDQCEMVKKKVTRSNDKMRKPNSVNCDDSNKSEEIHKSYQKLTSVSCVTCHLQDMQDSNIIPAHVPVKDFQDCLSCHKNYKSW